MRPKEDPAARAARTRKALITQRSALEAQLRKARDYLEGIEGRLKVHDLKGAADALLTVQGALTVARGFHPIQIADPDDEIRELYRQIYMIHVGLKGCEEAADAHFLRLVTIVKF